MGKTALLARRVPGVRGTADPAKLITRARRLAMTGRFAYHMLARQALNTNGLVMSSLSRTSTSKVVKVRMARGKEVKNAKRDQRAKERARARERASRAKVRREA